MSFRLNRWENGGGHYVRFFNYLKNVYRIAKQKLYILDFKYSR